MDRALFHEDLPPHSITCFNRLRSLDCGSSPLWRVHWPRMIGVWLTGAAIGWTLRVLWPGGCLALTSLVSLAFLFQKIPSTLYPFVPGLYLAIFFSIALSMWSTYPVPAAGTCRMFFPLPDGQLGYEDATDNPSTNELRCYRARMQRWQFDSRGHMQLLVVVAFFFYSGWRLVVGFCRVIAQLKVLK